MMPELTFGSLFAGIGGFDLGFERAGMKCAWQVEIDDFCQKVLEKHWPGVDRHGDIRECGRHNLEPVDVIAGGFPCQPHSVAGKRRGKADDRNLWPEYLRLVREIRPRWVVGENVPGLISTMLDEVLSDLEGEAYTVGTLVVPAVAFDAPHRRDRVFVVAYSEGEQGRDKSKDAGHGTGWYSGEESGSCCADAGYMADATGRDARKQAERQGRQGACGGSGDSRRAEDKGRETMADAERGRLQQGAGSAGQAGEWRAEPAGSGECRFWLPEPDVGRVANGVPSRVDRLKSLGNAVVPQVAEWIGRQIVKVEGR